MAENLDIPSFGNFSIESTVETGAGDPELLNGLFAPETATSDPDNITDIEEEEKKTPSPKKTPKKPVDKTPTKSDEDEEEETEKEEEIDPLQQFLSEGEEEEEEEKEPEATEEKEEEEEEEPKAGNTFSALAKDLFKIGVFTKGDEEEEVEITTPEQFLERFNLENKKRVQDTLENFLGQFGEDYKAAFNAIYIKGVDPKEYFGTYNKIEDFASLDLSLEASQEAVMREALAEQGLDSEDISKEIEKLKNYGDLEETATRYHKVLVKKQAQKLAKLEEESAARIEQATKMKTQYMQNVQSVLQEKLKVKEFDGIPLNNKLANELYDYLVTDKYKTPSGETLTEFDRTILDLKRPENHEKKVKVGLLLKLLEKDPTLSTIQKRAVTKNTDTLFGELARQSKKTAVKSSKTNNKPTSWFL